MPPEMAAGIAQGLGQGTNYLGMNIGNRMQTEQRERESLRDTGLKQQGIDLQKQAMGPDLALKQAQTQQIQGITKRMETMTPAELADIEAQTQGRRAAISQGERELGLRESAQRQNFTIAMQAQNLQREEGEAGRSHDIDILKRRGEMGESAEARGEARSGRLADKEMAHKKSLMEFEDTLSTKRMQSEHSQRMEELQAKLGSEDAQFIASAALKQMFEDKPDAIFVRMLAQKHGLWDTTNGEPKFSNANPESLRNFTEAYKALKTRKVPERLAKVIGEINPRMAAQLLGLMEDVEFSDSKRADAFIKSAEELMRATGKAGGGAGDTLFDERGFRRR